MSDTKRNECLGELNAPTQAMLNAIRNNYVASGARQNMLAVSVKLMQLGLLDEAGAIDTLASSLLAEACLYDLLDDKEFFKALLMYAFDATDFNQIAHILLDEEQRRILHKSENCDKKGAV